jgi:3D (Asp-Asp-Asp) domain-containing protein
MIREAAVGGSLAWSILAALGCATGGSAWLAEPLTRREEHIEPSNVAPPEEAPAKGHGGNDRYRVRTIGGEREEPEERLERIEEQNKGGQVLGLFRNTYYDFPSQADFTGSTVPLKSSACETIADVPKEFHDAVCVQGSGLLTAGQTVSFARRDCECAETCPRTGHRICFDVLDVTQFPWGRGALGKPITPLLTIAVDSNVIPMGTAVYIPEFDGLPTDPKGTAMHDGCFIAQDRGSRVVGKHVDVFTGQRRVTALWNHLVPSNNGVTVVLESPRCGRGGAP